MRSGVDMHSADNRWGVVESGRACSLHLHAGVGYISVRIWTPAHCCCSGCGCACWLNCLQNGRSVDTTMGLTPLEGLMMGTRCGEAAGHAVLGMPCWACCGHSLQLLLAVLQHKPFVAFSLTLAVPARSCSSSCQPFMCCRRHRPRHHPLSPVPWHEHQGGGHADEQEERLPGPGRWVVCCIP